MLTMTQSTPSKRERHAGTRTCVGCGVRVAKDRVREELVRLVLVEEEGGLRAHVDLGGSNVGRGSWVHARPTCWDDACARGLARSAKAKVSAEPARLGLELREQAARRIRSLLGAAVRSGLCVVGSDASRDALRKGACVLLLVAKDAAAASKHPEVEQAARDGAAVAYGTKALLGEALGRTEVGVIAVCDDGMAATLRHTIALSETFDPRL